MVSPLSLVRLKMGSVVVDLGDYSPTKKVARVELVPRIHLIPLLMILVFFVLWAGSTEVLPEDSGPEIFVMRMATTNRLAPSEHLMVDSDEISQHGSRRALEHDHGPRHKRAQALSTNGRYMRGATR